MQWLTALASAIPSTYTPTNYNLPGVAKGGFTWLINNIANAMLAVVATAAVLFMIIGAFQYVLAAGNEELSQKGKKSIMWALIGMLIALFAWSIVNILVKSSPLSNDNPLPTVVPPTTTTPAPSSSTPPTTP